MANFWMTVGSPHLHTDDRVRRTLCRQHTVDVPIYRPVVARPKRTGKQGKPVNRYTGENARTCTRRADVSPQTSIWRVCVSPAVVVACNYSIICARVCNTAVHRRQQFSYDSSALSAQAGVHSIGVVVLSLSWHNSPAAHGMVCRQVLAAARNTQRVMLCCVQQRVWE